MTNVNTSTTKMAPESHVKLGSHALGLLSDRPLGGEIMLSSGSMSREALLANFFRVTSHPEPAQKGIN
jgi:hypothetical protein